MAAKIFDKIRELLGFDVQRDIVPPAANIPRGLARDLKPHDKNNPQAPRAGGRLKGKVVSVNTHQQVYIEVEEDTEELLALSEDVAKQQQSEGIDPYNTGQFTTTGAWEQNTRR